MTLEAALRALRAVPRRYQIGAIGIALAVAIASAVVGLLTHAPRVALFAQPLRPEQVSEVQEQLAQWSVPFTPVADNVVVDVSRRNEILLRLSLAGIP
ncbi:MAG TPA: hypothetical protein VNF68_14165, partial [Candidatus Baltobacteraceae bacterium]|nr:hypothetical protein [Candidatus Baltobacteraceae bacterium]